MPEIEIVIDPQGNTTISTVDLLENYWADFLFFRKDASISWENGDVLRTHRYLRSGLSTFMNYLNGLVNRWQSSSPEQIAARSDSTTILERLAWIADKHHREHPPAADLSFLSNLASRCSNLKPGDEKELFHNLSFVEIDASERRVILWLDGFVKAAGLTLHAEARSLALPSANAAGPVSKEDYRDFDDLGDDPHPFQDPPGTWDEYEQGLDANRSPD